MLIFFTSSILGARFYRIFGGQSEKETPVLIPNTEVKLLSADGTARETWWESRSLPNSFFSPHDRFGSEGFFLRKIPLSSFNFVVNHPKGSLLTLSFPDVI